MKATTTKSVPDELVLAIVLAAVAMITFCPAIFGPFIFDDRLLISDNPIVQSFANWKFWFTHDFWDLSDDVVQFLPRVRYWRPLVTVSYALDWRLGGGDPLLFHVVNLFLHAATSILAFTTLRRYSGSFFAGAIAAFFFAVHPTHVENVAWIAGRTDILCLLAMLVATRGLALRLEGKRSGLVLEVLGTLIAYGTKEGAVILPAFAAIEGWVAAGRPAIDRAAIKQMLKVAAPQLVIAVGYLLVRARVMPMRPKTPAISVIDHLLMILESFGEYLVLTVAPHNLSMHRSPVRMEGAHVLHVPALVAAGSILLLGAVFAFFALRKRSPAIAIGIAFFVLTLTPVANVMLTGLLSLVSDRFLYAPHLGLALAIGVGLDRARGRFGVRPIVTGFVVAAALFAVLSLRRSADFSDNDRFWAIERERSPNALPPLRVAIARAVHDGRPEEAFKLSIQGIRIATLWYQQTGVEIEMVQQFVDLHVKLTPDLDVAALEEADRFYLAVIERRAVATFSGRGVKLAIPIGGAVLTRAADMHPTFLAARADIASRLGRDGDAERLANEAVERCRTCLQTSLGAAIVSARAGHYPEARGFLDRLALLRGEARVAEVRDRIQRADLASRQADVAEGPVQLKLRADALSDLEAWGRAYEILRPYRAQIARAPGFAYGFAKLAFRAGDRAVGREVLAGVMPEDKLDAELEKWSEEIRRLK